MYVITQSKSPTNLKTTGLILIELILPLADKDVVLVTRAQHYTQPKRLESASAILLS